MKKWLTWIIIVVVIAGGGFVFWQYRANRALEAALQEKAKSLSSAVVERRDLDVVVTGKGTVQADTRKDVKPGVSGTVSRVFVREGSVVSAGTSLFALRNDTIEHEAEQAKLDLALAEQELARLSGAAGSRAKAELDLRQAELALNSAKEDLKNLSIKSPIAGDLWDVAVKVGDSVKAGQVVATVADASAFTLNARVRQADLSKIGTGLRVSIKPGGEVPTLYGTIERIASEGKNGSDGIEFPVEISIDDPGTHIRAGMIVQADCRPTAWTVVSMQGKVEARDRRNVEAGVSGTVLEIASPKGRMVRQGQLILTLENNAVKVAHDKAESGLEGARQALATSQDSVDRQKLKVDQARIASERKAQLAAKLTVKSPIAGKVVSVSAEPNDDVSESQVVAQLASDALTVVVPVDELDVTGVAIGQQAKIEIDALPGKEFQGVVTKVAQEGKAQQGVTTYGVTVEIRSAEPMLRMSAKVTIAVARKTGVLSVPVEAVIWEQNQAYVNKLDNGQLVKTRVKVGVQSDLYAEIASGLAEGDKVVVGRIPGGKLDPWSLMIL